MNRNRTGVVAVALLAAVTALIASQTVARAGEVVTPESPRYVEKLTDEQLAVAMEDSPGARAILCLEFAAERIRELQAMAALNRFDHAESLVHSWRILVFSGAIKTAQQGSAGHHDMRDTFKAAAEKLDAFKADFQALAGKASPSESELFSGAAELARKGAAEVRESLEREMERVARHRAMLQDASGRILEGLGARGVSAGEASRTAERLREECALHEQLRAEFCLEILSAAAPKDAPFAAVAVAARANSLVDAGCAEAKAVEAVRFMASRGFSPADSARVLREVERFSEKAGQDRTRTVAGAVALIRECIDRGSLQRDAVDILRKSGRMVDKGVPPGIVFEVMSENLRTVKGKDSKEVMTAVETSLRSIEAIRDKLKKQAQSELDRFKDKENKGTNPDTKGNK